MSGFELVTITFSFVIGLGVAQILSAASFAMRERRERPLHWLPLSIAGAIFLAHVQFWFALFGINTVVPEWTWTSYGPLLMLAVLLFLSGGTVLPPSGSTGSLSLLEDFETRGKLSLLLLAIYMIGWIPLNVWFDEGGPNFSWTFSGVWFNLLIATSLLVAYRAKDPTTRDSAVLIFLALQVLGVLFVWATPDILG